METEEVSPSFLNKKSSEATIGDSLKMALVASAIVAATPIVIQGVVAGGKALYRKCKKQELSLVESTKTDKK